MTIAEKAAIADAVVDLRERFRIPVKPEHRGPVMLSRFLEECNLLHVTLPKLTRATAAEYLVEEGFAPDPELLVGGQEDVLAGCMLAVATDGYVFVGQREPVATENGEVKERFTTQPRQRFTVAHELGHFILHKGKMGRFFADPKDFIREEGDDKGKEMERQANRFAAELLMPTAVCKARAEAFRAAYRVCPLQPFAYHLAAELLVSPEAMRYRLKELKELGVWHE